jgi:DNA ligase-1
VTSFEYFANTCANIEQIPGSLEMTDVIAKLLKEVTIEELPVVTHFVMGSVFPAWSDRQMGIGNRLLYTALSKSSGVPEEEIENIIRKTGDIGETAVQALSSNPAGQSTFSAFTEEKPGMEIKEVYERFTHIADTAGKRSQGTKIKNLQYLFNSATPIEARYLARLAIEQLRIGVGEGIVRDAISKAFETDVAAVERAFMLTNDLGLVAVAACNGGNEEVKELDIQLNRPVKMMLAQVTPSIQSALNDLGEVAVEWKFDGARVQIHKEGDNIHIFSRRLENVTSSLPDVVKAIQENVKADTAILEGEAVAIGEDGKPRAFQDILKRFRRKYDVEAIAKEIPLKLNLFDVLYLNGESLIDNPLRKRRELLYQNVQSSDRILVDRQVITDNEEEIQEIYADALRAGHEGIMIKKPDAPYSPGKRGKNWLKKKPLMETLDLVVIGAEWGYGRRANLIGSYALGCYDPDTGKFPAIGKVATGITDEKLAELTTLFSDLIVYEAGRKIELKPEIVFEIAFEEIQKSPNYESGYALRFPRLVNVRDDKSPEEAESLERIGEIYHSQRS